MNIRSFVFIAALFAVTALCFVDAQESPPKPSGQFIINVQPSTNLNANFVRVTGGELAVDNALTNWTLEVRWEAWRTNGGGQQRITDKGTIAINMTDLKALMNAANPKNALKNAILADAALSE